MEDGIGILITFILIIWIAISCVVGNFGTNRKIGFWGAFWGSFLLSPLMGMLFVLASDKGAPVKYVSVPVDPVVLKAYNKKTSKVLLWLIVAVVIMIILATIKSHS